MTIKTKHERLTVLHVATLNQPIKPDLGYGPIETIIHNIDKGLHFLGHTGRSLPVQAIPELLGNIT